MKLSVSAFRAQASAQRKILSSYQNQLNYGACTSFPALGGFKLEEKPQMMVDNTGISPPSAPKPNEQPQSSDNSVTSQEEPEDAKMEDRGPAKEQEPARDSATVDKSPGKTRTKSNQRWMKLRTTVQISGAITSTNQKSKPPLKREDSFLKRFSTRQITETQETVDTGDETETLNGSQTQNEVNRRRRKRRKELSKTVVNPDENFYFYWLMTVTVCVLYNLWTLIVRQSFPELQKAASAFWYSGDGFTDVVFVCDIFVQFRTGYLEQGLMVYDSKKLASHYLKSRAFTLDILSLLPLDFLQLNIGVNPILRFPRFLKIYRVYNYYYIVESRTVYPNLWRVVNLIHILLILAHWFGCFYYLLSEAEGFQGDWVYPYRPGDYATLTRKYLGSLYWSTLTLTTIGDLPTPETNAESRGGSKATTSPGLAHGIPRRGHKSRLLQFNSSYGYLFTIISYLIGVFIFATIVGQVGNVITNRNANRLEFERLLDGAKTYMRHHKVPGGMKRRVLRWYDYSWSRGRIQGGGDINTALGLLPDKLKTELALHVNLSVLKKVTIFQECQPEFLHDLVLKMKAYIFTPGDLICRKGEVAREMFIIADGILDVISETGRVLTTMKAGDFFGEIGILNLDGLNKRTADVRSVGYSELFSLSREDVLTAMKDYPEAQEILQSLGRKRLMEAKNASKMHKAQAKQAKDHDSSGDSDTAGKRIVEKLRSDVKGLKNALRRSRRGTRTKETFDGIPGNSWGKTSNKKHSILRRMSHVQSSDEYETETAQSPIGAGLPLLQRLKLLKEKQDKEKEEKEKGKALVHGPNQNAKDEGSDVEVVGADLPFAQRLKLLKQKEDKESAQSVLSAVSSTVRTQVTGVRFDKSIAKSKSLVSPKDSEEKINDENGKKKDGTETGKPSLKEKLKLIHGSQPKEKAPKPIQDSQEATSSSNSAPETQSETSINVPEVSEADNSVPKSLRSKFEVPKSKDGWKLLKKSSITKTKTDDKSVGKVSKRGTYLSKSDTVLEKQETEDKEEDKRSRSASPSDSPKNRSLKQAVERLMRERRRTRSLGQAPGAGGDRDVNFWEYPKEPKDSAESKQSIKKYDSISDLSPEYSGLPFVKKLKILNERQKLAELEKELLVRSASLDVPDRPGTKRGNVLVRSQSEASTIEITKLGDASLRTELETMWKDAAASTTATGGPDSAMELRSTLTSNKKHGNRLYSDGSIASPESNETLERRHLKSILKKLSAEDSTSDEDQASRNFRSGVSCFKRSDNAELKKLMRAPTIEGYAARHKKLTKSVTFDSDTLPSPPDPGSPQPEAEENKGKGFSPMSPTAILTLQLSNLSMIPIVSPKKTEGKAKTEMETPAPNTVEKLQEEIQKFRKVEKETENPFMPYFVQDFVERNFRTLPFTKNQDDELFGEIKGGIQLIVQGLLEEVQNKFQSQFDSLQVEVKKRDEIILQLQSKIQQLEKDSSKVASRESFEGLDSSETDPDMSDVPFLRGDSFETILGANSPTREFKTSPRSSPGGAETKLKEAVIQEEEEEFRCDDPNSRFNYLGNAIMYEHMKNYSEAEEEVYEMKDKICLLSDRGSNPPKRRLWRPLDPASDEEHELPDVSARSEDHKRKRTRTEFRLKRNLSVDETQFQGKTQRKGQNDECRSRGSLLDRVTDFQRSFSVCHDNKDFVALDIDDSSNSSDLENPHNKDWEVQMLVEELEKKESAMGKDSGWEGENEDWTSETETETEHLEDVKKLQEEVNTLKQMVCESDLTRLTGSELDILESILEAKDQKISQIAKSSSLDDEDNSRQMKQTHIGTSSSDNRLKRTEQKKKPSSLRQKIGQALSFDFHDIESRKSRSPDHAKPKPFTLRKQKTISGTYQERQSLYTLWHTSSLLRNRVLEDSNEANKMLNNQSTSGISRSSLPILISSSLGIEKSSDVRTSLPTLSGKDFRTNFGNPVTPSVSSSEDTYHESDFKQSCDSVFEEAVDVRSTNHPSTSGSFRPNDSHNSLNSFIKSVGQKVKQVMAGDMNTVRSQVPTISKLCDEQSILKDVELGCPEDFGGVSRRPSDEEGKAADADGSKLLDCNPKTDPPDL